MAEQDRKTRFAGRLKRLLDVAVEQKNVSGGASIARLVCQLEGWLPTPSKDEPAETIPAADMQALLTHIEDKG